MARTVRKTTSPKSRKSQLSELRSNAIAKSSKSAGRNSKKAKSKSPNYRFSIQDVVFSFFVCCGTFLIFCIVGTLWKDTISLELGVLVEDTSNVHLMGPVGEMLGSILVEWHGWCAFAIPLLLFVMGISCWKNLEEQIRLPLLILWGSIGAVSLSIIFSVFYGYAGGGKVGSYIAFRMINAINKLGTLLITGGCFALAFGQLTGLGFSGVLSFFSRFAKIFVEFLKEGVLLGWDICRLGFDFACNGILGFWDLLFGRVKAVINESQLVASRIENRNSEEVDLAINAPFALTEIETETEEEEENIAVVLDGDFEPILRESKKASKGGILPLSKESSPYTFPPLSLLQPGSSDVMPELSKQELLANCKQLEKTLRDFRVAGKIVEVQPGPVITLYQFQPAPGVKVQKVINLADDLALSLKTSGVRVYAPVPGQGTIGIEVPNEHRAIVRLHDVLADDKFNENHDPLPLALGKDTLGETFNFDLAKMPHLLIAGATGTGKSVCINSILLSLLYRNSPDDLQLILIDPKMLELSVYEDIPHLKAPVITNPRRARGGLWWAVQEMDKRYELMKTYGVRSLAAYNAMVAENYEDEIEEHADEVVIDLEEKHVVSLPQEAVFGSVDSIGKKLGEGQRLSRIVIVVDELADLMLTVGKEVEDLLTRLAQKARAAGIHLILATQRPSVNVITGLIKANFPSRISFKVASKIDSRTVLDGSGAERLLSKGDMLFMSPGGSCLRRLHGSFISDAEVSKVVDFLRTQGSPEYDEDMESLMIALEEESGRGSTTGEFGNSEDDYDSIYDEAVEFVIEKGQASTSMIQRAFRLGYNRAARIIETMEREGVVGPADGSRPRKILTSEKNAIL